MVVSVDPAAGGDDLSEEQMLDRVEDLKDLMAHWLRQEAQIFRKGGLRGQTDAANRGAWLPPEVRARVAHKLRLLLSQYDATSDLAAALTLFDALGTRLVAAGGVPNHGIAGAKMQVGLGRLLSFESIASPPVLAAIARVTLKCSSTVVLHGSTPTLDLIPSVLEMLADGEVADMEKVKQCPGLVTIAEVEIVGEMDGHTGLVGPPEWACAMIDCAAALATPDIREGLHNAKHGVMHWARLLTERIVATPDMPPRALALGACVLGLCSAGVLPVGEVQPNNVSDSAWRDSLPGRMQRQCPTANDPHAAQLHVGQLAEAAGYTDVNELRKASFGAVAALQASLFDEDTWPSTST